MILRNFEAFSGDVVMRRKSSVIRVRRESEDSRRKGRWEDSRWA